MDISKLIKNNYARLGIDYVGPPRLLTGEEKSFRVECLKEELHEFIEADNIDDQYDALLDLCIFAIGTINQQGLPFNPGMVEVMRANYKKEVGVNPGKTRNKNNWSADLVKPEGWKAPDLTKIIDATKIFISAGQPLPPAFYPLMDAPKVLVLGHGRHGKDTFANLLFESLEPTSYLAAELIMMDAFTKHSKYGAYPTTQDCYENRHSYRAFWHEEIKQYNKKGNWTKFAEQVFDFQDCYVGMRAVEEFEACVKAGMFDIIFWVDRLDHEKPEAKSSMAVEYDPDTMVYIDNNKDEASLRVQADYYRSLMDSCFKPGRN